MDERKLHSNDNHMATPIAWDDTPDYRRPKPWGKIAVFLIIIGAVLFAAGWASGARGGRVYFENGLRVEAFPLADMTEGTTDLSFNSHIHTINVNATSHAIRIVPTSDAAPRVVANNRGVTTSEVDGRLYINVRNQGTGMINGINTRWNRVGLLNFGGGGITWNRINNTTFMDFNFDPSSFRLGSHAIRVYVPNTVTNIEARSTSGSVRMEGVSTTQLSLRANSGGVSVDGGTHGNIRLQSNSGSIHANGHFGDIYARAASSSVTIQDYSTSHRSTGSIQLRANSGSVRFSTRAPISDFRYELSVSSGSMRVDGARLDGRRASGGTGNTPITAGTNSGSIHLDFSN